MKIVTTSWMRELDRQTIEEYGISGATLMERAGNGLADQLLQRIAEWGLHNPFITLLAGRGNNGGDAFVAAIRLRKRGLRVKVWLVGLPREGSDALTFFNRMQAERVAWRDMADEAEWDHLNAVEAEADVLVDALLGTGAEGAPRGVIGRAVDFLVSRADHARIVAVDIPSGLNADTGKAEGAAVRADLTVTLGLPKCGCLAPPAYDYVGHLTVVDIGIPHTLIEQMPFDQDKEFIDPTDLAPLFARRARASHKGVYGHVLIFGGACGYSGAVTMAALAALRSGAGLATVVTPFSVAPIVAGRAMEAMVKGAPETSIGSLAVECWKDWRAHVNQFKAVLIGPGMTRHVDTLKLVRKLLRECRVPMVIDADALSVLGGHVRQFQKAQGPLVLTPHPGEMALLLKKEVAEVQAYRSAVAMDTALETGATVVLKGAGSVVAHRDQPICVNLTGNPGMATGGSGDVLAGMIAGLIAQGLDPFDAARAGVYLHGRAGDRVAARMSEAGMIAGDLLQELPLVVRELCLR